MTDPVSLAESKNNQANILYNLKQYANALHFYNDAISICPQISKYHSNRSACNIMLNNYTMGLKDAQKSVELNAGNLNGYLRIATCYLATGDLAYASNALQTAHGICPDDVSIIKKQELVELLQRNLEAYEINLKLKHYRLALDAISTCLEQIPYCLVYKLLKAECLVYCGDFLNAHKLTSEILRVQPTHDDALYVQTCLKYYQSNIDEAFQSVAELKRNQPDHFKTDRLYRNVLLYQKEDKNRKKAMDSNNYELAYEILTKMTKIDPKHTRLNRNLYLQKIRLVYTCKQLLWLGTKDCSAYLANFDHDLLILKTRAKFYEDLSEYDEALEDYKKILELDQSEENQIKLKTLEDLLADQLKSDYKILKVSSHPTKTEVTTAYKDLAKRYHPDKNFTCNPERKKLLEQKMRRIREAYSRLSKTAI